MYKKIILLFILLALILPKDIKKDLENFYAFQAIGINGDSISMESYKGKNIMIVNVASKCSYTPQYEQLEALNQIFDTNLVILGFPSNDFFWQEPGTNAEIKLFCQRNYGVTFQLFEKIHVKGKNQHPIYDWLSSKKKNGWNNKGPSWNFFKYLINTEGILINYFPPSVSPLDTSIINLLLPSTNFKKSTSK